MRKLPRIRTLLSCSIYRCRSCSSDVRIQMFRRRWFSRKGRPPNTPGPPDCGIPLRSAGASARARGNGRTSSTRSSPSPPSASSGCRASRRWTRRWASRGGTCCGTPTPAAPNCSGRCPCPPPALSKVGTCGEQEMLNPPNIMLDIFGAENFTFKRSTAHIF